MINCSRAVDSIGDTLYDGRFCRTLNLLDEGNRDALAIEVGTLLLTVRVVRVLEQLVATHEAPAMLLCDDGPDSIAQALVHCCEQYGILPHRIQPGKSNQNAFIERFSKTYRDEVLDG